MPDLYLAPKKKEIKKEKKEMSSSYKVPTKKKSKQEKSKKRALSHHCQIVKEGLNSGFSLAVVPKNVRFTGQQSGERALILLRRHIVTNVPWFVSGCLVFLATFPLYRFSFLITVSPFWRNLFLFGWLLLALGIFWAGFLSWYFNVNIISNKRIVDIDFYNLIYREVTDAEIEKIQDVTHKMGGILGIFLNYGDIYIQTAGTKPEIEFLKIPRPAQVAETIQRLIEREKKEVKK